MLILFFDSFTTEQVRVVPIPKVLNEQSWDQCFLCEWNCKELWLCPWVAHLRTHLKILHGALKGLP